MAETLNIRRVDNLEELAPLRDRWDALAAQNAVVTPFQTWEWFAAWQRAYGGSHIHLWVLLAEADGQLVGVAPLILRMRRVLGRRRRVLEFPGADLYRACDFIVDRARPDVPAALLDWLNQRRNQWDLMLLANFPESSPTLPALAERAAAVGQRAEVRDLDIEPTRVMGDAEDDHKVINKREIRREYRRFCEAGEMGWRWTADPDQVLRDLETFARFHMAHWDQTDTPSDFHIPAFREFHRQLVLTFAPTGWFGMSALTLDGEPVTLNSFFEYQGKLFLYETSYDLTHAALSPGNIANIETLKYALDHQIGEVIFGRGRESYKFRYANRTPVQRELRLWARRASYTVDHLVVRGWEALGRVPAVKRALERRVARNRPNARTGLRG